MGEAVPGIMRRGTGRVALRVEVTGHARERLLVLGPSNWEAAGGAREDRRPACTCRPVIYARADRFRGIDGETARPGPLLC